ncbi:MAG TPA: zf-HC2 domain-containing protein [Gemmatimonadales bacterium]|nr:zf-HC2 domain-containing protein [Gemmatimonadales bacterium]
MDCVEAIARLWEYLDDELAPTDSEALRAHLSLCRSYCRSLHAFDRAFLHCLARARAAAPVAPAALLLRVQEHLQQPPA